MLSVVIIIVGYMGRLVVIRVRCHIVLGSGSVMNMLFSSTRERCFIHDSQQKLLLQQCAVSAFCLFARKDGAIMHLMQSRSVRLSRS
jgi:hypothetical protein